MLTLLKSKFFIAQLASYIGTILLSFMTLSYIFFRISKKAALISSLPKEELILILILLTILFSFIGALFAFITSKKIFNSMNQFITAAENIIEQNYHCPITLETNSDLDKLIHTFNKMQSIIYDREKELQMKNTALEAQNLQAMEVSKLKSEFLANMSHELRTPLNSIIGFTTRVIKKSNDQLDPVQLENLTIVKQEAYHLLQLINGLLDYSKIEAGKMELQLDSFDLAEVLTEVESMVKVLTEEKSIEYKRNLLPDQSFAIYSDRLKIKQVLINLLSNAVKYSEKGTVTLSVVNEGSQYRITINDEGIGIAPEHLNNIFKEFIQIDGSYTRKVGGTGLGLTITKNFVEMLGGHISVQSTLGGGSSFTIVLPNQTPQLISQEEPCHKNYMKKIVCVDDDPNAIRLYKQCLNEHDFDVIALNGTENVMEKIIQCMPNLLLLDIMLPNRDGWQILSDMKTNPKTKEIPVIMISVLNEKNLAFKMYADEYLVKPITQDELINTILHIIPDEASF